MKKLLIMMTVASVAIASQAVQAKWATLQIYAPDANGSIADKITWNGTKWTPATDGKITTVGAVEMFTWESTTASDVAFSGTALWDWYAAGADPKAAPLDGVAHTGANTSGGTATVSGETTYTTGDKVYAAVLLVYTDPDNKQWYMQNATEITIGNAATTGTGLALFQGGGALNAPHDTVMSWTAAAVPEPTSGLLLLLGVAGLALRRRRA